MKPKDRKTERLTIRLTPDELDRINRRCVELGVTPSNWVRSTAIRALNPKPAKRLPKKPDFSDLIECNINEEGCFTIDGSEDFDYRRMIKIGYIDGKSEHYTMSAAAEDEWNRNGRWPPIPESTFLYWIDGERFALITESKPPWNGRIIKVKILDRGAAILWMRLLGQSKAAADAKLDSVAKFAQYIDMESVEKNG